MGIPSPSPDRLFRRPVGFPISTTILLALVMVVVLPPHADAGVIDLEWEAPSTNVDGSPLTDLDRYRVYLSASAPACGSPAFRDVPSTTSTPAPGDVVTYQLTDVPSGITYYITVSAIAADGNESACSNQVSTAPKEAGVYSGGGGGGGGCFIATAAFGSPWAPQVQRLQAFRDRHLLPHGAGRAFVRLYYRTSPPIAGLIERSSLLRALVRIALLPILGWVALVQWVPALGWSLPLVAGALLIRRAGKRRWRRSQ